MAPDDQTWLEWGFKGLVGFLGWLGMNALKDLRKDIKSLNDGASFMRDDILRNYVTKPEVNTMRLETNNSLDRIHRRIDEGNAKAEENFKETREDIGEIKNLIMQQGKNKA